VGSASTPNDGPELPPGVVLPIPQPGEVWVVGAVIREPAGRLFVQRRTASRRLFPDSWDLVGGHIESGEPILEALAREITEETGWTLSRIVACLGVMEYTGDDGVTRKEIDFLVEVDGDLDHPMLEPGKHEQPRWIGRDEIGDLLRERRPGEDLVEGLLERAFDWLDAHRGPRNGPGAR
jgi:8-oxo-dGTP diphosphatase